MRNSYKTCCQNLGKHVLTLLPNLFAGSWILENHLAKFPPGDLEFTFRFWANLLANSRRMLSCLEFKLSVFAIRFWETWSQIPVAWFQSLKSCAQILGEFAREFQEHYVRPGEHARGFWANMLTKLFLFCVLSDLNLRKCACANLLAGSWKTTWQNFRRVNLEFTFRF